MDKAISTKFKTLFLEHNPDFKATEKSVWIDGKYQPKGKFYDLLHSFYASKVLEHPFIFEHKEILPDVVKGLTSELGTHTVEEKVKFDLPFDIDDDVEVIGDLLETHAPAIDILTGRTGLIEKGTTTVSSWEFDIYKGLFEPKEWRQILASVPQTAFIYDTSDKAPARIDIATPRGIKSIPTRNTYLPPKWVYSDNKKEDLHADHKQMIESRFVNAESVERYFCTLYHMLTNRNKTLCGLVHKREGTGKSTVMGKLPGHLVGMENTSYTDKNFMSSPHKDALLNKRMVFLDEHRLRPNQMSIEKQFVEDRLYINPKGKAALTIPNTISFFMTSNSEADIYTEPTNRRHYFLEDSGRHIVEEFGEEWVAQYNNRLLQDTEFIANLGYYVLNEFKDPKYPADAVYKGPSFERIVKATCFESYSTLLDKFLNNEEDVVTYADEKSKYYKTRSSGGKGLNFPKVEHFIDFFTHVKWGGEPIVRVEKDSDNDITLTRIER